MSGKRARASVSKALERGYSRDESLSPRRRISQLRRYLKELVRDGEDLCEVLERLDNGSRRRRGELDAEDAGCGVLVIRLPFVRFVFDKTDPAHTLQKKETDQT
jgi:hypothetical protein